jgi:diadenosine tetraphosphate (Ap4A) HIT family hydrolase
MSLDDTVQSYDRREDGCVFCRTGALEVLSENELCYSIYDQYPVTKHHTLIIPRRHVSGFFDLYQPEIEAIHDLLRQAQKAIGGLDKTVTGFNVGVNSGEDAGQTIFHCHIHLIPRRKGDTPNPRGGVRGVIPDKQSY